MENEIIQWKIDWTPTLNRFTVGQELSIKLSASDVKNTRQRISAYGKNVGKVFITKMLDGQILFIKRLS